MSPINILLSLILLTTYSGLVWSLLLPPERKQKEITTCEGLTLNIRCGPREEIDILRANFGRTSRTICNEGGRKDIHDWNCISRNSDNIVKAKCEGQQSCTLQASSAVFGDPCVGTFKYLDVEFRCVSKHRIEQKTEKEVACESTNLSIKCERGYEIDILRANYGRQSRAICNKDGKAPIRDVTCSARNSERIVKEACEEKQHCNILAADTVFGDPCFGTLKYLEVEYRCSKDRRSENKEWE